MTSETRTEDERRYINLKYEDDPSEDLNLMGRVYYDWFRYKGDYIYDVAEEEDEESIIVPNKDFTRGERWGLEMQAITTVLEQHKLSIGTEYFNDFHLEQANFDVDPFFSYLDDRRNSYTWGVYLQDEFRISKQLAINAGVRHDYYQEFGHDTNPRVGLIINPLEETTVKLIYGTAFRHPNSFELYYDTGGPEFSNPNLDPEEIETYEIVLEQAISSNLQASISTFYYEIDNFINQIAIGPDRGH